jgi:predicted Zn finger-like uncharacterized protein
MAGSNMDLFTCCTGCETVFRVTTGDLQASGGQVRCGRCQTVFDAFASLTARPPGQTQEGAAATTDVPAPREYTATDSSITTSREMDPDEPTSDAMAALDPVPDDLEPQAPMPEQAPDSVDAAETQIPAEAVEPPDSAAEPSGMADRFTDDPATNLYEWEFKATPKSPRTRLWLSLSLLLVFTAIAQAAYAFRTELMVNYPQARPVYVQICVWLSCEIGLPRLVEQLDISASDLQLVNPQTRNQVELTALVRNRARVAVEFPAFELTLTNEEERVVARRVFLPDEYLSDVAIIGGGLAGRGELAVRLFLDIGPLGAAGYRIYLFYPS